jgi:hypothetical protein
MAKKRKFKNRSPRSTNELKRLIERKFEANLNTIAPYTLLLLSASILFFLTMMSRSEKTFIEKMNLDIIGNKPTPINIPNANTLYIFEGEQAFSSKVPSYSELEIELLDENFNHVYTVYESLWQEKHDNGDGGMSIYSDKIIEFEISLQHAGTYHIRANSYNGNKTKLSLKLYKKRGSMYFLTFLIIFGTLLITLLISFDQITGIQSLFSALHKTKITKTFIIAVIIVIFVFISCVVISNTHYGYPHSGDEIRLPTQFFSTNNVIYLG